MAFDATETREHEGPLHFLEGFTGYLQGDAYSGNLTLRKKSPVVMVGCMAHLRRYFVEALEKDPRAAHFIAVIKQLYEVAENGRDLSHEERRALCQARAAPLLRELMRLARVLGPDVLPKSPLGEALTYLRNQMRYVAQYLRDGRLEIDDNGAERQLRVLFCDTDLYATCFYAEEYFGFCPDWIRSAAASRRYDLHLLLDADVPWVEDAQRDLPHRRGPMLAWLRAALESAGRPYRNLSGSWDEHRRTAIEEVEAVLRRRPRSGPR